MVPVDGLGDEIRRWVLNRSIRGGVADTARQEDVKAATPPVEDLYDF